MKDALKNGLNTASQCRHDTCKYMAVEAVPSNTHSAFAMQVAPQTTMSVILADPGFELLQILPGFLFIC